MKGDFAAAILFRILDEPAEQRAAERTDDQAVITHPFVPGLIF
jgi:hypothetical protein